MKDYKLHESYFYHDFREMFDSVTEKHANKIAYSYKNSPHDREVVRVSYAKLASDVRALAEGALSLGLTSGHVAIIGKLTYRWICVYFALLSVGAVIVPLDADWTAEELRETVKRADCTSLFISEEAEKSKGSVIREAFESDRVFSMGEGEMSVSSLIALGEEKRGAGSRGYEDSKIDVDALAELVFTSGTTGKGKGVMLSQKAIISDICSGIELIEVTDKTIGTLPPHHTFGSTINIVGHFLWGAEFYISSGIRFIAEEIRREKPSHLVLVPLYLESFWQKIISSVKAKGKEKAFRALQKVSLGLYRAGIDLRRKMFSQVHEVFGGNLRLIICGGAPLRQSLIENFESIGIDILNGYGITECAPLISVNRNRCRRADSVGRPIPIETVKIDRPNESGEGEICVRGDNVMLGYYKDETATAEVFDKFGYFHTGDCGKTDKDGWLYITGRQKNLIILSNGKNVYPEEIEQSFTGLTGVIDAVVYEGESRRGSQYNTVVLEIHADLEALAKEGVSSVYDHFYNKMLDYNRTAIAYKKIGLLRIREEAFPKNTLRKIVRFKIDRTID